MRPQSAKAKGRRLQQEVRDALLTIFPELQEDDIRSTSMGASGEDLLLSPAARKLIPFSIECKNVERLNVWEAIKQASERDHQPLVVFRKNNTKPYAIISFDVLLSFLSYRSGELKRGAA